MTTIGEMTLEDAAREAAVGPKIEFSILVYRLI